MCVLKFTEALTLEHIFNGTNCIASWSRAGSQWTTNSSDIYYNAGYVGVEMTTPNAKVTVYGGGIKIDSGGVTKPACNNSTRGLIWFTNGGNGNDTIEICQRLQTGGLSSKTIVVG